MANEQENVFKEFKKANVTQFFTQNRSMLGYSYPSKSLVIAIHELVTNSIDNCIMAGIKPEIFIKIEYDQKYIGKEDQKNHLILTVQDNGTGIPKKIVPTIFSTFLQGTKFRVNRQTMGQQGLGATGVVLFSLIETGQSAFLKTGDGKEVIEASIKMNLETGESENKIEKIYKDTFKGSLLKIYLGNVLYGIGQASVDEYLREIYLANPFVHITFINPDGIKTEYKPIVNSPSIPIIEKYHPLGLTTHDFLRLLSLSKQKTVGDFIARDLQRSSQEKVKELNAILKKDLFEIKKDNIDRNLVESIIRAIHQVKWKSPKTDSLIPIGEENLSKAIDELFQPEFKVVITRPPKVYRGGVPFIVEIGLAWGEKCGHKTDSTTEPLLLRFANRTPLLFDSSSDVLYQALKEIDLKRYIKDITNYPLSIIVNVNSTFIPYNNTGKLAIDDDEDIKSEFKNAMFDGLRKISTYINKKRAKEILEHHKSKMKEYEEQLAMILHNGSNGYKSIQQIKSYIDKIINKLGGDLDGE
jgi:DNA topoisomerase-6 subunit B